MVNDTAIQQTMLIPLWGRAQASHLYPEILVDEQAIDIVEHLDFDFSPIAQSFDGFGAMSHLVRAKSADNAIRIYSKMHPEASVVNIGCGLDTNLSRVDNDQMHWYDLDLPDALAFRNTVIPQNPRAGQLPYSVFDTAWFEHIDFSANRGACFVACGVLFFFHEEMIRELFIHMAEAFPGAEMIFDANSSIALERSKKMMEQTGNAQANMFFSVDDPTTFETWSPNIHLKEAKPRFYDTPRLPQMNETMKNNMDYSDTHNMIIQVHLQFG